MTFFCLPISGYSLLNNKLENNFVQITSVWDYHSLLRQRFPCRQKWGSSFRITAPALWRTACLRSTGFWCDGFAHSAHTWLLFFSRSLGCNLAFAPLPGQGTGAHKRYSWYLPWYHVPFRKWSRQFLGAFPSSYPNNWLHAQGECLSWIASDKTKWENKCAWRTSSSLTSTGGVPAVSVPLAWWPGVYRGPSVMPLSLEWEQSHFLQVTKKAQVTGGVFLACINVSAYCLHLILA